MKLKEIKAKLGLERIPFNIADPNYPEWRSHFDASTRVQYVMADAIFKRIVGGEDIELYLYSATAKSAAGVEYTKHLIGEEIAVEYI